MSLPKNAHLTCRALRKLNINLRLGESGKGAMDNFLHVKLYTCKYFSFLFCLGFVNRKIRVVRKEL